MKPYLVVGRVTTMVGLEEEELGSRGSPLLGSSLMASVIRYSGEVRCVALSDHTICRKHFSLRRDRVRRAPPGHSSLTDRPALSKRNVNGETQSLEKQLAVRLYINTGRGTLPYQLGRNSARVSVLNAPASSRSSSSGSRYCSSQRRR